MTASLALDNPGFSKFVAHAGSELQKWFGSHCNHDAARISFMAAREWEAMSDHERKPFIKSATGDLAEVNPYVRYLLHKQYSKSSEDAKSIFDPKSLKLHSKNWKSMSAGSRNFYSNVDTYCLGMDFVLDGRSKLHQLYEPGKLHILEFILKTKPRWPICSRLWFFRSECASVAQPAAKEKWSLLSDDERGVYERCAVLDRKRFDFEKNAWITKMLNIDFTADEFTLEDFSIQGATSKVDTLGTILEISKQLPASIGLRRPRNPFSLFIEAYRYQIRDERPEFQFGRHLKECSEAWNRLSEEEKDFYKQESRKLKAKRRELLANEPSSDSRLTLPVDLFSTSKLVHGPCRPAHLYKKIPSLLLFFGEERKIKSKERKSVWDSLPECLKKSYIERHQRLAEQIHEYNSQIDRQLQDIKEFIKGARKLDELKHELRLVRSSRATVRSTPSS